MNPEVKRWDTGEVIIPTGKYASLKEAVEKEYGNLRSADLKNIPQLNTPTINEYIEKFKIEKEGEYIYAFKGVMDDLQSPNSATKIKYTTGVQTVDFADCDVWQDCSYGISLSPTKEAAKEWGTKILKVKVHLGDIVCIPIYGNDKKFRVKKLTVLKGSE